MNGPFRQNAAEGQPEGFLGKFPFTMWRVSYEVLQINPIKRIPVEIWVEPVTVVRRCMRRTVQQYHGYDMQMGAWEMWFVDEKGSYYPVKELYETRQEAEAELLRRIKE